jgi:hypothetical protein
VTRRAWPLALVALVPLWIVASAASRGQGFFVFVAGAIGLALALAAFRRGRRDVLFRYVYLLVLAAAGALAFEALLHLRPSLLHGRVANVAYTGYHWQGGGVYALEDHAGPVLRPGVRRSMYWNGHWWRHETGRSGWRGPDVDRADAVFLGDSMIYGHGVDEPDTVPARYAARTGQAAVNLGQQGTCQIQSLLALERHGRRLRPSVVFASLHPTDVEEALRYYDEGELGRYAEAASAYRPFARAEYRPRPWWDPVSAWSRFVALPMRCAGISGALLRSRRKDAQVMAHVARDPFVPTAEDMGARVAFLQPDASASLRLGWQAERRAVRVMKRTCDDLGARLVVLDLGYPRAFSEAVEALAHEVGAVYDDAGRRVLARALGGERVYLADDGHWSAAGSDAIAKELAEDR